MVHVRGNYAGATRTLEGDLQISFNIDDNMDVLDKLSNTGELVLDIKKYSPKRSLNANAYFWVLCTEIAKVIGSDKDTVYLLQLEKYGVFVDVNVIRDGIQALRDKFRYIQELSDGFDEYKDTVDIRCYFGSSHYNKEEMSVLIDGTVRDAQDLGISTWDSEEIKALVDNWKGDSYG